MIAKKKLCLVIPSLLPGGMERVMSELSVYFCQKNEIKVHLVLYGRKPETFYNVPEKVVISRPNSKFNNRFRIFATIGRLIYIRRTITNIKPDAILSFGEYWNSFVLIALFGLPFPVFISDRCSPEIEFGTLHKLLRRVFYPHAKGIIAQTEKARKLNALQFRNDNICVIGNPIRKIESNGTPPHKENIVLTVGRLIKSKHHDKLIQIFADIFSPGWKLIIVGEDALNQKNMVKLKKLILELNMDKRIILAGKQANVESYYLKSKIFAFTSSSEGFPNVIGEAMSAGLPVVSFDCVAGPGELIQNEMNGFLVPVFDFKLFGIRLHQLMESSTLRKNFGIKARESIQNYSLKLIGEKYYNFIFNNLK